MLISPFLLILLQNWRKSSGCRVYVYVVLLLPLLLLIVQFPVLTHVLEFPSSTFGTNPFDFFKGTGHGGRNHFARSILSWLLLHDRRCYVDDSSFQFRSGRRFRGTIRRVYRRRKDQSPQVIGKATAR